MLVSWVAEFVDPHQYRRMDTPTPSPVRSPPLTTPPSTSLPPATNPVPAATPSASAPSATVPSTSRRLGSLDGRSKAQRLSDNASPGDSSRPQRSYKQAVLSSLGGHAYPSPSSRRGLSPSPAISLSSRPLKVTSNTGGQPVDEDGWQVVVHKKRSRGVPLPRRRPQVELQGK
jgi:hypothetical protein